MAAAWRRTLPRTAPRGRSAAPAIDVRWHPCCISPFSWFVAGGTEPVGGPDRSPQPSSGGDGLIGGGCLGWFRLEVRQPVQPAGQVPAALAEQAQGARQDDQTD